MKTSYSGLKFIESFEGLILGAYDDANDKIVKPGQKVKGTLTIGYGHTSAAGLPKVYVGQTVTSAEADAILAADLASVEADVNRLVKVPLNQNQFDALVSFHFNTGSLAKSSTLTSLNRGDYQGAAENLMKYTKGRVNGQLVPMQGLVRRRTAEKAMFLSNSIPHSALETVTGASNPTAPSTGGFMSWFSNSETILLARLSAVGGAITALVGRFDWAPLWSLFQSGTDFTAKQVFWIGISVVGAGIIFEIARRHKDPSL